MNKAQKEISKHFAAASELASKEVEQLARRILAKNPQLDEFVMGMGNWFFTLKDGRELKYGGQHVSDYNMRKYATPIDRFINEWNEPLKITGEPMRFTANGPKITNW